MTIGSLKCKHPTFVSKTIGRACIMAMSRHPPPLLSLVPSVVSAVPVAVVFAFAVAQNSQLEAFHFQLCLPRLAGVRVRTTLFD